MAPEPIHEHSAASASNAAPTREMTGSEQRVNQVDEASAGMKRVAASAISKMTFLSGLMTGDRKFARGLGRDYLAGIPVLATRGGRGGGLIHHACHR